MKRKFLFVLSLIAVTGLFYSCMGSTSSDPATTTPTDTNPSYTQTLNAPTVSLDDGSYLSGEKFTVTYNGSSVKYSFTTDGTDPKPENASISAVAMSGSINSNMTFKVMVVDGYNYSPIVTRTYTALKESTNSASAIELTENVRYNLNLATSGDMHFFMINTTAGKDYQIRTFSTTDNLDTMIYVYDNLSTMQAAETTLAGTTAYTATGEVLYNNNEDLDDDPAAVLTKQSLIHIRNANGNPYYIIVKTQNDTDTGNYDIIFKNITDNNDANLNVVAASATTNSTDWKSASLDDESLDNVYAVNLTSGTNYQFQLAQNGSARVFDVQILDGTFGTPATCVRDMHAGWTSASTYTITNFQYTAKSTGIHYIIVTAYDEINDVSKEETSSFYKDYDCKIMNLDI